MTKYGLSYVRPLEDLPRWIPVGLLGTMGAFAGAAIVQVMNDLGMIGRLGLFLLLFIALFTTPVVRRLIKGTFDPLEFRNVFLLFFALYTLSLPLLTYLEHESVSKNVSTPAIAQAFLICLGGLICYLAGYHVSSAAAHVVSRFPKIGPISSLRLNRATVVVSMLAILWISLFVYSLGGVGDFLRIGYTEIYEVEQGKELLGFSFTLIPTCVLLIYSLAHRTGSRIAWLAFFASSGVATLLLISGSRRRLLITVVVALLVYRHYVVKRMSFKLILSLMIGGALGGSMLGVLRAIPPEQLLSNQTRQFISEQSSSELFYAFLELGEPATDFETFPFIVQEISSGMPYQLGRTYLDAPLIWIPKVLYPSRPETASQWYTNTFFPKIAANLGGNPLFFLGEAYLNFGFLGPLVLMFILGIASRVTYLFLQQNNFSNAAVLIYATAVSWIPSAIRIDFATTLKVSIASSLPVILLVIWYSRKPYLKDNPVFVSVS